MAELKFTSCCCIGMMWLVCSHRGSQLTAEHIPFALPLGKMRQNSELTVSIYVLPTELPAAVLMVLEFILKGKESLRWGVEKIWFSPGRPWTVWSSLRSRETRLKKQCSETARREAGGCKTGLGHQPQLTPVPHFLLQPEIQTPSHQRTLLLTSLQKVTVWACSSKSWLAGTGQAVSWNGNGTACRRAGGSWH